MSYPDRLLLRGACALLGDELRFEPAPLDVLIEGEYRGLADRYAAAEASSAPVIEAVAALFRRSLASAIPPDTHRARL